MRRGRGAPYNGAISRDHVRATEKWERAVGKGTYIFSSTMPLAMAAPPKGLAFNAVTEWLFT